jgi:hypothetical protein
MSSEKTPVRAIESPELIFDPAHRDMEPKGLGPSTHRPRACASLRNSFDLRIITMVAGVLGVKCCLYESVERVREQEKGALYTSYGREDAHHHQLCVRRIAKV